MLANTCGWEPDNGMVRGSHDSERFNRSRYNVSAANPGGTRGIEGKQLTGRAIQRLQLTRKHVS